MKGGRREGDFGTRPNACRENAVLWGNGVCIEKGGNRLGRGALVRAPGPGQSFGQHFTLQQCVCSVYSKKVRKEGEQ